MEGFPIFISFITITISEKKETHAVVYTARVFSERSRPHLTGVQAPSLCCLLLSYNQFNTRFFSFVFYFGLQFIITPIAKHKFLFFGNPNFVLLIFKNKSRRLMFNTKINKLFAVQMKSMIHIPTFYIFSIVKSLLFAFCSFSRTCRSNAILNPLQASLYSKSSVEKLLLCANIEA